MTQAKVLLRPCPHCGQASPYSPANPWRPFCSERCQQIDLGVWADEGYRVPGESLEDACDLADLG